MLPFGEGLPFDLGACIQDGTFLRIQVKTGRVRNGCVEFNSCSTDHGRGRQHYRGRVDLMAVYVPPLDRAFVMPVAECPSFRCYLRLEPARNNQVRRVKLAEDYTFERWVESLAEPIAA